MWLKLMHASASGMACLHYYKIIHGDLKDTNVLVDDLGTAKITDFSLSKMKLLSLSSPGHRGYGTMYWTDPEFLKNNLQTRAYSSDVYAFWYYVL